MTVAVWGISAIVVLVVVVLIPFNIDCARDAGGSVRQTVTRFQAAAAARDWEGGCALLTTRARVRLAGVAAGQSELSQTCASGLQIAVRRREFRLGRIEKVSAPVLWDDATVTTRFVQYRLSTPDNDCSYLIKDFDY